ncbi:MAG: Malonyl CoA-acyl carrier protein transacylase, partial [Chthonomonadales bacterium]|nr:Malonyl CoA-acyl carrier protein transacylase [Chthonomonadales bacterium]
LEGRNYPELGAAYGLFAKTLPIPCRLSSDISFAQLLAQVTETQAQSERWQDYAPEMRGDTAPDLGIVFEKADSPPHLEEEDTSFVPLSSYHGPASYRLKLTCSFEDAFWRLSLHYDAHRFETDEAERIADYLRTLLAGVIADPETPLDALNLLPESMRRQLLETWNATEADYPRDLCVHTLFEAQVARTPHAIAVVGVESTYTYQELNVAANRLAHRLRGCGVGRETRVGLLMERTAAMIVGVLGILKAGGAYVPLTPDTPKLRVAHQLQQTEAQVVVTLAPLCGLLSDYRGTCICLDEDAGALTETPDSNPETLNASGDLVYVIYTSGSTGQPKGVENTHRGLVNYTTFLSSLLGPIGSIPGLQFASVSALSADLGNTSVFPCLLGGGTLHVLPYEVAMNASRFASYSTLHAVDVLKITPSHLSALLASSDDAGVLPRRCLFLGGEASSWELMMRIRQAGTCRVINHYGPTEATIGSLVYPVPEEFPPTATVPIGRPIANTRIYLLDSRLLPVPIGVQGELYIGGDGLARGYIGQKDLTDSRFVSNPFAEDGSRLYRTGDLARYLADGSVEFLGRIDDQVKIRGFRVEPGEIEAALRSHVGVRQTIVVSREDSFGEKRLVGYYVGSTHDSPTEEDLKAYLQDMLPEYMIPYSIVRLTSLPLAPNGKVDRAALPAPEQILPDAERERILPRTPVEKQMASIWQEIMGSGEISVDADFFELGGHSLMAIQVMSRVRATFRVEMPLNSLFEASTIASLSQLVVAAQQASTLSDLDLMIDSLEDMSEEEAEALLAQERQGL